MENVEARVDQVAAALDDLNKRVEKLETSGGQQSISDATNLLNQLKQLRATLTQEQKRMEIALAERDQAIAENEKLKTENAKLNYRIVHLIRNLEAEEAKTEELKKQLNKQ
eukprot:GEZU01010570.1.p1 GENE.GEZU01010570.1~~GEZU01010570.1.p1  ORF type:complete len:111 (+),score=50.37 GEZU01010570.1:53-385(+)